MPDEFGTVNVKRDRTREIEVMRQQYRRHRESLAAMAAEAPTEQLAVEYNRLIAEIDKAVQKLEELEGRPFSSDTQPVLRPEPGRRPLVAPPTVQGIPPADSPYARSRLIGIIGGGILVLLAIGWLLWKASSDERPMTPIVTEQTDTVATAPVTPAPPPELPPLTVEPSSQDFAIVRKGTRAARQFEIANNTSQPISIQVPRSACRCLYYDYASVIAPKGKEIVTVTIDGARAKSGRLSEALRVSSKSDPTVATTLNVTATVR